MIDRQRALVEVPSAPAPDGWSAPAPSAAAVAAARRLAPAAAVAVTVHHPPFAGAPELLVEGDPEALARWAAERGLAASRAAGLSLRITTPRLAQDAWRGGTRAASLLSSAVHIGGEPLAPRLGFPEPELLALTAEAQCHSLLAQLRFTILGKRRSAPDPTIADRIAAWRRVMDGEPLTSQGSSAAGDWALRGLGPGASLGWRQRDASLPAVTGRRLTILLEQAAEQGGTERVVEAVLRHWPDARVLSPHFRQTNVPAEANRGGSSASSRSRCGRGGAGPCSPPLRATHRTAPMPATDLLLSFSGHGWSLAAAVSAGCAARHLRDRAAALAVRRARRYRRDEPVDCGPP